MCRPWFDCKCTLWQVERFHQEDRHLGTGDGILRAVIAAATAACDALGCQLLDPSSSPVGGGHIIKAGVDSYCGRAVG